MAKKNTMFDSAPVVEVKSPAAEKEAKNKTREVNIGESQDFLAAINALSASLETASKIYYNEVTSAMSEDFTSESMKLQKRPDNFKGIGPNSTASCQLKKRSSRSYLNDEEVKILVANKISYDVETISEELPERFFFNPEILTDSDLAEKISEKLGEIPELAGKQVVMKQAKRDKVTKNAVSDVAFDQIAKLTDAALVKQLLSIVGSYSVNAKLTTQDLDTVLDLVRKAGVKL